MENWPDQLTIADSVTGEAKTYTIVEQNDNRFSIKPAYINEDETLALQHNGEEWVIAGIPYSKQSIVYSSGNNWPLIEVVE